MLISNIKWSLTKISKKIQAHRTHESSLHTTKPLGNTQVQNSDETKVFGDSIIS